jgi:hypothetical protein
MSEEATRKGAEEQAEQEVRQEPPHEETKATNPRQALIDAMVAKRRAETSVELDPEQEDEEPEDQEPPDEDHEELVTIKVDGKEQQVPRDKVYEFGIRALQKELAADARLAEVANMRRQLESERYAMQQREAEISALAAQMKEKDQSGGHPTAGVAEYREEAKALLKAMYDGEEDAAIDQLVRFRQGRGNVTPEDLQRMVAEASRQAKLEVQQELKAEKWNTEVQEAREWFEREHKDIATDPEWRTMADRETADLIRQHPDWFPKQIVKEAVARISKLRKSVPESSVNRRSAKQQIDNPRPASGRQPAPSEPPPKTRSQYIQDLRRSRGLQT